MSKGTLSKTYIFVRVQYHHLFQHSLVLAARFSPKVSTQAWGKIETIDSVKRDYEPVETS